MSTRHIRKILGNSTLPPPDESDEEYEPSYVKKSSNLKYAGLEVESPYSELTCDVSDDDVLENAQPEEASKKKKNKKKNKKVKQLTRSRTNSNDINNCDELDEIDRSVKEINELLGSPPPCPSVSTEKAPQQDLFNVHYKHLDFNNELRRIFGPEVIEKEKRRGRQPPKITFKKDSIVPMAKYVNHFHNVGLSMSMERREDGNAYFTFNHNKDYRKLHGQFLRMLNNIPIDRHRLLIEDVRERNHVEGLLENADVLYRMEEYSNANELIEEAIAYMQYTAHPLFSLTNINARLDYKVVENRPFHVAVLKYLHVLTNKVCHRTALELAKVLLNLDPSDPLAVVLIIDVLAIRAREYQWLIDLVAKWSKEKSIEYLFNFQYSHALAQYHLALINNGDTDEADTTLQCAIMHFPAVVTNLLQCALVTNKAIETHPFFQKLSEDSTPAPLKGLIKFYAHFACARWKETIVMDWLIRNSLKVIDQYDNDEEVKTTTTTYKHKRLTMFQKLPREVERHMCVIQPMANLLVDGAVPEVSLTYAFDPMPPPNDVNRYTEYAADTTDRSRHNGLLQFFFSVFPQYDVE